MYFAALNYCLDESSYFLSCRISVVLVNSYFCMDGALKFLLTVRFSSAADVNFLYKNKHLKTIPLLSIPAWQFHPLGNICLDRNQSLFWERWPVAIPP